MRKELLWAVQPRMVFLRKELLWTAQPEQILLRKELLWTAQPGRFLLRNVLPWTAQRWWIRPGRLLLQLAWPQGILLRRKARLQALCRMILCWKETSV